MTDLESLKVEKGNQQTPCYAKELADSIYRMRLIIKAISLSFFSPPKPLLLGPSPPIPSGGRRWVDSRWSATPNLPADRIPFPVILRASHFFLALPPLVLAGLWPDPVTKLMTGCVPSGCGERARLWQSVCLQEAPSIG
ncbi:hypothetical protein YC2023_078786 [Brassica napus]